MDHGVDDSIPASMAATIDCTYSSMWFLLLSSAPSATFGSRLLTVCWSRGMFVFVHIRFRSGEASCQFHSMTTSIGRWLESQSSLLSTLHLTTREASSSEAKVRSIVDSPVLHLCVEVPVHLFSRSVCSPEHHILQITCSPDRPVRKITLFSRLTCLAP